MEYRHQPVMLREVLELLKPYSGGNFIDCTLGGGGYTRAIAERVMPSGRLLSIDLDNLAIRNAKKNLLENIIIVHGNFKNLKKIIETNWPSRENKNFNGVVFDLGLSSAQLEDRSRGFAFKMDAPIDMAFGGQDDALISTKDILNNHSEEELFKIFINYGEEKYSRSIARNIIKTRKTKPITTTGELVKIISQAVPPSVRYNKHRHFATKIFQALRIATNDELTNISEALPQALSMLASGGRLAVISYHSLEDRIVKNYFKLESRDCLCPPEMPVCQCGHKARLKIITKKAITPSPEEISANPRARSGKLRVAEKI
jgi:16S rRNA (cytosine1402-N4)-methyltransferase